MSFRLLIVDLTARSLLIVDGATNIIIAELPLSSGEAITAIFPSADSSKVFLPAAGNAGKGSLYVLNLLTNTIYRLPVSIAHPAWFTLANQTAYLADPSGQLYTLDTIALTVKEWEKQTIGGQCAGLAATSSAVFSLWENEADPHAIVFSPAGEVKGCVSLPGTPVSLTVSADGNAYAACWLSDNTIELVSLPADPAESRPACSRLSCPVCRQALTGYPSALASEQQTLFVVTDDGTFTALDLTSRQPVSHAILTKPLDSLHLLPDGRRAIGHSLARGDLALLDLEGGRIIAMSVTDHRLGPIGIVPV